MDTELARTFLTVLAAGNFSQASSRLFITLGGRFGLWEKLLLHCLPRLRAILPDTTLRAEMCMEDELMQGLLDARMDIGVMYTPQRRPGMVVEPLFDEQLVFVSSQPSQQQTPGAGYVYVDWGPEFANQHNAAFPDMDGAGLVANIGWLGLEHILNQGGAGYFPLRLVQDDLRAGRLYRNRQLPEFLLPAWLVYLSDADPATVGLAVQVIRDTTAELVAAAS